MKSLWIISTICLIYCFFQAGYLATSAVGSGKRGSSSTSGTSTTAESKIVQIQELASKSKNNMLTLDDASYAHYALNKPRPYSLIVLLTAAHPKFKCAICKQIDNEISLVAQAYADSMKGKEDSSSVYFIRLDYENAPKSFQGYGVNSVPLIFYISPLTGADSSSAAAASSSSSAASFAINARDKFQFSSASPDAESIASFLRDRTGVSVTIKRSMFWSYVLLLVLFAVMAAMVRPVINTLPFWLNLIRQKFIWVIICCGLYTCAISGLIYDIIRNPQMYYANPGTGQIMFFYPQSGHQFVVEGFVIGFLNLICALSVMLVIVSPQFKDEQNRLLGMIGGIVGFIVCFRMTRSLYVFKNPWYGQAY